MTAGTDDWGSALSRDISTVSHSSDRWTSRRTRPTARCNPETTPNTAAGRVIKRRIKRVRGGGTMFALVSYRIDDITLRDEPDDRDAAWDYVRTLKPGGEKVVWLRMLGELTRAEAMGWELLAAAGGPDSLERARGRVGLPVEALAPAVRLAHVLHWQERFRDADVLFAGVIASANEIAGTAAGGSAEEQRATMMLAFALQHLGKSRFDEGRLDEALGLFQRAHALRQRVGAPDDQIASSQQAIAATRARVVSRPEHASG